MQRQQNSFYKAKMLQKLQTHMKKQMNMKKFYKFFIKKRIKLIMPLEQTF